MPEVRIQFVWDALEARRVGAEVHVPARRAPVVHPTEPWSSYFDLARVPTEFQRLEGVANTNSPPPDADDIVAQDEHTRAWVWLWRRLHPLGFTADFLEKVHARLAHSEAAWSTARALLNGAMGLLISYRLSCAAKK